jgi:teichuronic acid biosynthesis glycosyltransferase TuaC
MRVAVLAEWYPSPADPVHGIWAHRQAVAARDAGAEVRVLALRRPVPPLALAGRPNELPRWAVAARRALRPAMLDGIPIQPVGWLGPPRPWSYGGWGYWMAPAVHRALDHLYARWRFDVLHVHNLAPAGHGAAGWARRHASAFVVSTHGPDIIHVAERSPVGRHAVRTALRAADRVLANSTWAERRCQALGGGKVPVSVVHLGATPVAHDARGSTIRVITVAHLQARKHHATVLRALAGLDVEYVVVGDGEERGALERLASALGVRADFRGQLPHDQAMAEMARSDLFVMPGVEEPFGVAFVEAMAAGVPAIGGRGEGGPEDIAAAGEGMLLVEPGEVNELAALIRRITADRAELARLGEAARRTVEASFTWERCGERTVAAYRQASRR